MVILKELGRHVRALGQKLTAENIHNWGQKAMQTAHVVGRKVSNTLHKIEDFGNAALPVASKIASIAGYPELGALTSAGNGLKRLVQARDNIDQVRSMLHQ